MTSYTGRLLVATPLLMDPNFWRTVILVLQHDPDGAVGVILNRPTLERVDHHLGSWTGLVPEPGLVHFGGPVEPQVAIAIIAGDQGEPIGLEGLSIGDVSDPEIPAGGKARIYAGYSGWSTAQLDTEIAEGSWYVVQAHATDPFDPPEGQWERTLRRQKGLLSLVSTFPVDVTLN